MFALLLALAVPVQAMAVVTAGICMAHGHHDAAVAHDSHHADDGVPHEHDHAASGQTSNNEHCPPCVACCAAASISGAPKIFLPEPRAMGAIVVQWRSPEGYQPDGLYRPPLAL